MIRQLVCTLSALVLLLGISTAQSRPSAATLAASLQQRYNGIRDFSADFVHTYQGGVLRKQVTERGTVVIKKPGMMRWNYTAPERKTFVSDGRKIYSYIPQDRQVIITTLPGDNDAPTPTLFLAGKGNVVRDFTASYAEKSAGAAYPLKLVPRRSEAEYEFLVLQLDPTTLQIRGLSTFDRQGGESTFVFSNLKENRGLTDKEFAFRVPKGVDVVTDDQTSR